MTRGRFAVLMMALVAVGGVGCTASRVSLTSSENLLGAEGEIRTSRTSNDNTAVDLRVKHLAAPERVTPGATTYVVWARPDGQRVAQNLGALQVDKNLSGSLKTVTAFQRFQLFITAEPDGRAQRPTGDEVLSAQVRRKGS